MEKSIVSVLLIASYIGITVGGWVNTYDQAFTFTCPQHQFISHILSHHDNHHEDRIFDFNCTTYTHASETCYWSGYVNNFDEDINFQCPNGSVMDGVSSYHDNHKEDRRFKFYCCEKPGLCVYNCYYTGNQNSYDGNLDFTVPADHVMRGWISHHDNHKEDRVFNFEVCKIQICQDPTGDGGEVIGRR